jgi:putative transposase
VRHPLHDYTKAAGYFVTAVAAKRGGIFGSVADGVFSASCYGDAVTQTWLALPRYFPGLTLDVYHLMPDHLHAILIITHLPPADGGVVKPYGLPQVMQTLKRRSALGINRMRGSTGTPVWQAGYHDRIIRSEAELEKYRGYIQTNPLRTMLPR